MLLLVVLLAQQSVEQHLIKLQKKTVLKAGSLQVGQHLVLLVEALLVQPLEVQSVTAQDTLREEPTQMVWLQGQLIKLWDHSFHSPTRFTSCSSWHDTIYPDTQPKQEPNS